MKMSHEAEAFSRLVERFCQWAEGSEHDLVEARRLLLSLIALIPDLLEFRFSGPCDRDFPRREHSGWKEDYDGFSDLPFQSYLKVFDPFDFETKDEPVTGDLRDDFADIYGDLWHGLQARQAGEAREALSIWIDSYFLHWGHHATSALYAIDVYFRQSFGANENDSGDVDRQ